MFNNSHGRNEEQRGITGLETAIILIAFVVVASVFAFTVLSTGVFSSERSKETVFAGLDEVRSSLQPRGSVIAYKGALDGSTNTIYKVVFVVSNAEQGESVNLTPPYTAGGTGDDPDIASGARSETIISYSDTNQFLGDVPWSVSWPGFDDGDDLLDAGETAEITVWLADRVTTVTNAADSGAVSPLWTDRPVTVARVALRQPPRYRAWTINGPSRSSRTWGPSSILSALCRAPSKRSWIFVKPSTVVSSIDTRVAVSS